MTKEKFTHGPWEVKQDEDGEHFVFSPHFGIVCFLDMPASQDEANANLISAAPELYYDHEWWSELIGRVYVMLQQKQYSEAMELLNDNFMVQFNDGSPAVESEALVKARGEKQ